MARLDALTLGQRKVVFAAASVALAAFVATSFATAGGQKSEDAAAPAPHRPTVAPPGVVVESPAQERVTGRVSADGRPPAGGASPDLAAVEEAKRVAAAFVEGYASYRYDEDPAAKVASLRPLITEQLATELVDGSGAVAARRRMADERRSAVATVEALQTLALRDDAVELLAIVRQDVEVAGRREQHRPTYSLSLARSTSGWAVASVAA